MPLAHRIIPTILCRGRHLVKGVGFDAWRTVGLAMQAMKIHGARGVDECCLLDITATREGRGPNLELVAELVDSGFFSPLAVGGGVRTMADVKALLRAGADKVVIGSAAYENLPILTQARAEVGSQAIVVSVDYKNSRTYFRSGEMPIYMHPVIWAQTVERMGAGEILLQAIERDGTMRGYDLPVIQAVRNAVGIPVIASGGAGCYDHMREALEAGASGVAAGAMFQFTDLTPRGAAEYLSKKGLEVRL